MYHITDNEAAIKSVQRYLSKIYKNSAAVSQNGQWDENTVAALNRFQSENQMELTSFVDYLTHAALYEAYTDAIIQDNVNRNNPSISFPLKKGDQSFEIEKINSILSEILRRYSFFEALPDGDYFSAITEKAVMLISEIFGYTSTKEINELIYERILREWKAINSTNDFGDDYFPVKRL